MSAPADDTDGYGIGLFPQHAALLRASAISPDMARARGYVSVDTKARLESWGFSPAQRLVPGLLNPLHAHDGKCVGMQFRPDNPRSTATGRAVKYETPPKQPNRLDVPPGVGRQLGNPSVDLWITEGARKADSATGLGLACVSLSGVWNWRATNDQGGRVALPDWQDVALNGRRVVLAFDSDSRTNPSVGKALDALAAYLTGKGARVLSCELPDAEGGKTGLDDYIGAGHGREDVETLVVERIAATPARPAKESAATALVTLALSRYRLGLSADDEPFAVALDGPPIVRALRGGKGSLRAELARAYYADAGVVATQQALADALLVLEGQAQQEDPERLHLRVAEHGRSAPAARRTSGSYSAGTVPDRSVPEAAPVASATSPPPSSTTSSGTNSTGRLSSTAAPQPSRGERAPRPTAEATSNGAAINPGPGWCGYGCQA